MKLFFIGKKIFRQPLYGVPFLHVMSIMFVVWPQSHETRLNWLEWQESNGKVSGRKRNMIQMKNSCSCGVLQRDIYKIFLKKEEQGSSRQRKIIEIRLWLQMSPPCPLQVNWLRRKETTCSSSPLRLNPVTPLTMWRPKSRIKRLFLQTSRGWFSLASNLKMATLWATTTYKKSQLFIWCCVWEVDSNIPELCSYYLIVLKTA